MATKNTMVCDVFGTYRDVERFMVLVVPESCEGKALDEMGAPTDAILVRGLDMSPRAVKRLQKFIERGLSPLATVK